MEDNRITAELSETRQQRAELAALYDIAIRLSSVREVDALLQEVVTQTRRLLSVDVAYLALVDDDSWLTIRVTEGSLGPRLRGVRLAPGSGLAGQVVDRGEPVTALDYLEDERLQHQRSADQIARDEGLRTITGVPLRLQGRVIGVLMIANREVRALLPRELSMLSSFASMVAVALDNARLFDELRRTAETLREVNADLQRSSEIVHRASTLHERLMDAALRGGGVAQVIASLSEIVMGEVTFADAEDRVVATAASGDPGEATGSLALPDDRSPSAFFRESRSIDPFGEQDQVWVPVTAVDEYFGVMKVVLPAAADDTFMRLLERAALTLALIESTQRSIAAAAGRSASELLEQLLERKVTDDPLFRRRALQVGLDLSSPHLLLVIEPRAERTARVSDWIAAQVRLAGGAAGTVSGLAVALLRGDTTAAPEPPGFEFGTGALAGPATGVAELAAAWQEARSCLRALQALGRSNVISRSSDLGPYHFLLGESGRASAQRFVDSVLGALAAADRRGELARTAEVYLRHSCRHNSAAAELRIHPNTLYQRLERISAILGASWKEGDRALDIGLAFRVQRLVAASTGSGGLG